MLKPTENAVKHFVNFSSYITSGKNGTNNPVILTPNAQTLLSVLIKKRSSFVPQENPYLFGFNKSCTLRGYIILNKMYDEAGLKFQAALDRRKYLNTKYASMNPSESQTKSMAQ
ncbi:uncharacterized protein LOC111708096 [Eurytemora carolleeae]|uniref:uncharacterized protein LOC111708096 n=1 Tax=Eurytemora carolleeae TaxID=1294199 RepID=UPI000C769407|nr:uncharacterized protein LOC111708096 [Eurytemora carolleeae]|eukprot:XP_023337130.1 uncharacterized protein LOC111708096 [Eurytemora affinis]